MFGGMKGNHLVDCAANEDAAMLPSCTLKPNGRRPKDCDRLCWVAGYKTKRMAMKH